MSYSLQQLFNHLSEQALDQDYKIERYHRQKQHRCPDMLESLSVQMNGQRERHEKDFTSYVKRCMNRFMMALLLFTMLLSKEILLNQLNWQVSAVFQFIILCAVISLIFILIQQGIDARKYSLYHKGMACNYTIKLDVIAEILAVKHKSF